MSQTTKPANPRDAYCSPRTDARLRLFCLPYTGGDASVCRTWPKDLPGAIDFCPVRYPGRETRVREPALTALAEMVDAAASGPGLWLDRPYRFSGHRKGTLVAFELAGKLVRSSGAAPAHLVVSGHRPPQLPYTSSLRHDLPEDAFIRQLKGIPEEAIESPELMKFILPIVRANCSMRVRTDSTPVTFPPTALGGVEDAAAGEDPLSQWRTFAGVQFAPKMFPGGALLSAKCAHRAARRPARDTGPLATR